MWPLKQLLVWIMHVGRAYLLVRARIDRLACDPSFVFAMVLESRCALVYLRLKYCGDSKFDSRQGGW